MARNVQEYYPKEKVTEIVNLLRKINGRSVYDCYDKPSKTKEEAFDECIAIVNTYRNNGYIVPFYAVTYYNTFGFTFAFIEYDTPNDEWLHIITKDNHYIIYIGGKI